MRKEEIAFLNGQVAFANKLVGPVTFGFTKVEEPGCKGWWSIKFFDEDKEIRANTVSELSDQLAGWTRAKVRKLMRAQVEKQVGNIDLIF